MKKRIISTICTVVAMLMTFSVWNAFPAFADETAVTAEKITDSDTIRELFTQYIAESDLDAKCVSDEAYPQYAGTVVIEFNSATSANRQILEFAEKNAIERTAFNLVPCADGSPIMTANPNADNTTTTTTMTTAEAEKITDIEQIRAMLIAFVAENGLDARIVSDKEYPGYRPIVVEFHQDAEINAWAAVCDYIEEQNIYKFNINVVPIIDGTPITTVNPQVENILYGDANCDNNVDVADAVLVARFVAEDNEADISEQGKQNADMNRDGNLTGDDVIAILRKIAKLD